MVRKRPLLALLVTGMITLVSPEMGPGSRVRAQQPALEPLVLYDDFNTPLINPDKWFGLEIGARSQLGDLPRPSGTEISRNIVKDDRDPRDDRGHKNHRGPKNRQLRLSWRAYGSLDSDIGTTASSHALLVTDPATITAMAGTITVKEAEAVGCVTTQHNTEARARLAGSFFNTATPTPGSQTAPPSNPWVRSMRTPPSDC